MKRRDLVKLAGIGAAAVASPVAAQKRVVKHGRIRQSVAFWCFNATEWQWDLDKICRVSKRLGCESVELAVPEDWAAIKKHGLKIALAPNGMPDPPFVKGVNNPRYHEAVIGSTKKTIEQCAEAGVPNVIAFTGYKWRNAEDPSSGEISLEEGADNCVKALKELSEHAEKKGVTVCLEQLNTRDDSHPMKGHPGYQGDDIDYCADIVKRVGSPRVKLLFDIYHVQVMNGDVIRRIRQYKELLGHVHVAGNPGRGELDMRQEINFPALMQALLDVGYGGFVGQEFIPTATPERGLAEAVKTCDV